MANPIKGERDVTIGEDVVKLCFDVNALCELEDMTGKPTADTAPLLGSGDMKLLRAYMWAACRQYHPDVTPFEAGQFVNTLGPMEAQAILIDVLAKAFPKPKTKEAGDKAPASPQTAKTPRRKATETAPPAGTSPTS